MKARCSNAVNGKHNNQLTCISQCRRTFMEQLNIFLSFNRRYMSPREAPLNVDLLGIHHSSMIDLNCRLCNFQFGETVKSISLYYMSQTLFTYAALQTPHVHTNTINIQQLTY